MKIFAERIKDLRLEKELSQRELAKQLGTISYTAIQKWEDDTSAPSAEAIIALAKFFGVSADYLLGLED